MNNKRPKRPTQTGRMYRLNAGPILWRLEAEPVLESWLAGLARILELEPWGEDIPLPTPARNVSFRLWDPQAPDQSPGVFLKPGSVSGPPSVGWRMRWFNSVRLWTQGGSPDVTCEVMAEALKTPIVAVEAMSGACFALFEQVVELGGFPLHAALVVRDGFGVGLAASGGTGKSTCARRIPAPWRALCDDTSLVIPGSAHGGFEAHPFVTWSDYYWKRSEKTWNVAQHVPLRAIFFLKQADEDRASAIGQGEAAIYLNRSSTEIVLPFTRRMGPEGMRAFQRLVFDNACRMAKAVPAFILELRLKGEFWNEMGRVLDSPRNFPREPTGREQA